MNYFRIQWGKEMRVGEEGKCVKIRSVEIKRGFPVLILDLFLH
jgi:hypothetical protein